jgi:hypothetical protein
MFRLYSEQWRAGQAVLKALNEIKLEPAEIFALFHPGQSLQIRSLIAVV